MKQPLTEADKFQCYRAANLPGASDAEVAEALGVTRLTVYNWRKGIYKPDVKFLAKNAPRADWVGEWCRETLVGRGLVIVGLPSVSYAEIINTDPLGLEVQGENDDD